MPREQHRAPTPWSVLLTVAVGLSALGAGCDGSNGDDPVYGPGTTGNLSEEVYQEVRTGDFGEFPAMRLVGSVPGDGATNVPVGTDVVLEFSDAVDPASLQFDGAIQLLDPQGASFPGSTRLLGPTSVIFEPLGVLGGATTYVVRVSTALRSLDGLGVPRAQFVTFSTGSTLTQGSLVINEIFAGSSDTNGLPTGAPTDEQFVEIVNTSASPQNLRGLRLSTNARPNAHQFDEDLVLPPGGALTVFGRAAPDAPGAVSADQGLFLNSLGDTVTLRSTLTGTPTQLDQVTFPQLPRVPGLRDVNESLTRSLDAQIGDTTGATFIPHFDAPGALGAFSPGARINGQVFDTFRVDVTEGPQLGAATPR